MIIDIPSAAIERFNEDFAFLTFINEDDTTLVRKIEQAIIACLKDSIRRNAAPQSFRKDKRHKELSYSVPAMGWLLAFTAKEAGAETAHYTLDWITSKTQILGVTYNIHFTIPNSKHKHTWVVTQQFMDNRYRWYGPGMA